MNVIRTTLPFSQRLQGLVHFSCSLSLSYPHSRRTGISSLLAAAQALLCRSTRLGESVMDERKQVTNSTVRPSTPIATTGMPLWFDLKNSYPTRSSARHIQAFLVTMWKTDCIRMAFQFIDTQRLKHHYGLSSDSKSTICTAFPLYKSKTKLRTPSKRNQYNHPATIFFFLLVRDWLHAYYWMCYIAHSAHRPSGWCRWFTKGSISLGYERQ